MRLDPRSFLKTSSQSDSVPRIGAFNDSSAAGLRRPEVEHRRLDSGVAAVQVSGELDLASVGKLEAKVEQALAQDSAPLLIDFTACGFIDSTVLSVLVGLRRRLGDSAPPRFAVVAQDQPLGVLRLTRLDREMPVYASLAEALSVLEVIGVTEPPASVRPGSS
jgi:anti-sigma B factor antagonist